MAEPLGPIEKKARADIRKLQPSYRNSAMAAAYLLAARMLDNDPSNRDYAAIAREMRLTYAQLLDMGGTQKPDSFVDKARKDREEQAKLHAVN
jgi:hypothetical protein